MRRCLAVLRSVCCLPQSSEFRFPILPNEAQNYYDRVLRPIFLRDLGIKMQRRVKNKVPEVDIVTAFQREFKLVYANAHLYNQSGSVALNNMEKVSAVFHRLFNDWVLCYDKVRPYEWLDDDLCVQPNELDNGGSLVLCDRCEGSYNTWALRITTIPSEEWFCPDCIAKKCFYNSDPRINKQVNNQDNLQGVIKHPQVLDGALYYVVYFKEIDACDVWTLEEVDEALGGTVPPLKYPVACMESFGYLGRPYNGGFDDTIVPPALDMRVNLNAARLAESDDFFNAMVDGIVTLRSAEEDWGKVEWTNILALMCDVCSNVDEVRRKRNELENAASSRMEEEINKMAETNFRPNFMRSIAVYESEEEEQEEEEAADEGDGEQEVYGKEVVGEVIGEVVGEVVLGEVDVSPTADNDDNDDVVMAESVEIVEHESPAPSDTITTEANSVSPTLTPPLTPTPTPTPTPTQGGHFTGAVGQRQCTATTAKNKRCSFRCIDNSDMCQVHYMKSIGKFVKRPNSGRPIDPDSKANIVGLAAKWEKEFAGSLDNTTKQESILGATALLQLQTYENSQIFDSDDAETVSKKSIILFLKRKEQREEALLCHSTFVKVHENMGPEYTRALNYVFDFIWPARNNLNNQPRVQSNSALLDDFIMTHSGRETPARDYTVPKEVCAFCGLSDVEFGAPLVRVPDASEWEEIYEVGAKNRRCFAVAQKDDLTLGVVKIRVGGLLMNVGDDHDDDDDDDDDDEEDKKDFNKKHNLDNSGFCDFLPKKSTCFQEELGNLYKGQKFCTGSLCAHEVCGRSMHRLRKDARQNFLSGTLRTYVEGRWMRSCGRNTPIGKDEQGRLYWRLGKSLLVQDPGSDEMKKFDGDTKIAAVIASLGGAAPSSQLVMAFERAGSMVETRQFAEILQGKQADVEEEGDDYEEADEEDNLADDESMGLASVTSMDEIEHGEIDTEITLKEGKRVLVKSFKGDLLYDARILKLHKIGDDVVGVCVHYNKFSSRYDEWISPSRLVRKTDENYELQSSLKEAHTDRELLRIKNECAADIDESDPVEALRANEYVEASNRARGDLPATDLTKALVYNGINSSSIGKLRAGLLLVESSLPQGAVSVSRKGGWSKERSIIWRREVENARGVDDIICCLLVLENLIHPQVVAKANGRMISVMPTPSVSLKGATIGSAWLRLTMLDNAIKYDFTPKEKVLTKKEIRLLEEEMGLAR